jgi:outer membrane protein assembly factor BamB
LWHFPAGHHVSSSPALSLDCSLVFIGSWGKSVYGLNATTGGLVWKHELLGFVSQSPALSPDGQLLYIGSEGGDFTALSSLTGATVWNRPSSQPNSVRTATVGSDNSVLVATYDRNLYCFNGSSGDQLWLLSFANSVSGSAVIGEAGYVYVGSSDTKVHCFRSAPVVQPSTMPSVTGSRTSTVTPSHAPPPLTGLALLCTRVCL